MESAEAKLVFAGKYAILAAQLGCYLRLSVFRGKLVMSLKSFTFILQSVANWLFPFTVFVMYHRDERHSQSEILSSMEAVVARVVSSIVTVVCVFFRIQGIRRRNETLKFWKANVKLFLEFEKHNKAQFTEKLSEIRNSLRSSFWTLLFIITFFSVFSVAVTVLQVENTEDIYILKASITLAANAYAFYFLFSHWGQAVWLKFYLKLYTAMLCLISERIYAGFGESECERPNFALVPRTLNQIISPLRAFENLNDCFRLYLKVEKQLKYFNSHFKNALMFECLFGILVIVVDSFFLVQNFNEGLNIKTIMKLVMFIPVWISVKSLYDLGSVGSQISEAASQISFEICNIYTRRNLNLQLRQDLQMFALRTSNPLSVNVGQYFTFNRSLLTAVRFSYKIL